jgi:hypothetical protein
MDNTWKQKLNSQTLLSNNVLAHSVLYINSWLNTVIPQFTSLICSSKTARTAKTRKTKINFPLLPNGNNDRFARERSSYKQRLARKLKKTRINLCISYKRKLVHWLLVYRGITVQHFTVSPPTLFTRLTPTGSSLVLQTETYPKRERAFRNCQRISRVWHRN